MVGKMRQWLRRGCAVAAAGLLVLCAKAQGGADFDLPADFTRVYGLDELADGDCLLIGANYEQEDSLYLMTGEAPNKKMVAQPVCKGVPQDLTCEKSSYVWRLREAGDGLYRLETLDGGILNCEINGKSESTANLLLSGTNKSVWNFTLQDEGTFLVSHKETPDRALGFSWWALVGGESASYFGNFKEKGANTRSLCLYRVKPLDEYRGTAVLPADGERVTLFARGLMAGNEAVDGALAAVPTDSCELTDGTLAPDPPGQAWECRHGAAEGVFSLRAADGTYLADGFRHTQEPFGWRISEGYIVPATAEESEAAGAGDDTHIYLLKDAGRFRQLTAEDAAEARAVSVELRPVGGDPVPAYEESTGELRLTGAWSARRLRQMDWRGVRSLDLRALSLPVRAADFDRRPAADNVPVHVAATEVRAVPASWRFVVAESEDGSALSCPTVLADKHPFAPCRPFAAGAGELAYERQAFADGKWETLCLPFAAPVPDGFEAEELVEISDGQLLFAPVASVEAGKPVIVRYVGTAKDGTVPQRWEAGGGTVETGPAAGSFAGVFDTLRVADSAEGVYLLESSGERFVRAEAGSLLMPFRAFVRPDGGGQAARAALSVRHLGQEQEGVEAVRAENPAANGPCYDLQGRQVARDRLSGASGTLSPGIYIRNGKKIIRK